METTKIEVDKTVAELQQLLGRTGQVKAVQVEYEGEKVSAVSFIADVQGVPIPFKLPARIEPVFEYLNRQRAVRNRVKGEGKDREQAERVAWRQILRWVQAQFALLDLGMADLHEIFMPYALVAKDRTLYELWTDQVARGKLELPEPVK